VTGDDDDRQAGARSQVVDQLQTIFLGELEVQDDQIDELLVEDAGHALAARDRADPKAVLDQVVGDQLAHRRIIIDHDDVLLGHRDSPNEPCA
jgi:hypothetical protein